ncbi:hypothetical protein ACET3Z_005788 [Daucus carota]
MFPEYIPVVDEISATHTEPLTINSPPSTASLPFEGATPIQSSSSNVSNQNTTGLDNILQSTSDSTNSHSSPPQSQADHSVPTVPTVSVPTVRSQRVRQATKRVLQFS